MRSRRLGRRSRALVALPFVLAVALVIAACGSSGETTTNAPAGDIDRVVDDGIGVRRQAAVR
jgi:hypothetical protein